MAEPFILSLTIDGEQQILAQLSRFGEYASDMRPAFEEMADDFLQVEETRFAEEGPGWAPLSPQYAAWKAKNYPGKGILERTGALRGELTSGPAIRRITGSQMILGTSLAYALAHQRGSGRLPQRKIIDLDGQTQVRWAKIAQAYLVRAWQADRGISARAGA